nr:NADH dehydrogenase [ubiquinone] iron-sulfur protein 2 [Tanacetum cinerariifolium]
MNFNHEQVSFHLGDLDLDLALLEDRPADFTATSTEAQKSHHKAWARSNRLCLNFIQMTISNNIKSTLPSIENRHVKDFLKPVEEKLRSADKALTWTLMAELTIMKFDGSKSMQQHVLDMTNIAARLKTLGVDKKHKPKAKNFKKKQHGTTSKVANAEKKEQLDNKCKFCRKEAHFQKDCLKCKAWVEKKDKKHPHIEHNALLIAREQIEKQEAEKKEGVKKEEDEKEKKEKKKARKTLTEGEFLKYDREWCELCDLIQLVNPNNVIPLNVLQVVLEKNMPVCDPSTGVEWSPTKKKSWQERISSTIGAYESFTKRICGENNYPEDGEPLFPTGIKVSRVGEGDAFQTSTSYCSWCFTISIGNERRSGGTCGTTYWITQVRHEAIDAESALMPPTMPCLVPRHSGGFVGHHEHRAKGRSDEWSTDRPEFSRALVGSGMPVKGASAYPRVIITTCTSNLDTVERVTRLLFHSTTFVPVIHSLTERNSEGQPAHTASGEDGTNGKDRLAKTPQEQSVVGLRRGSIRRKGTPNGGRARGGRVI